MFVCVYVCVLYGCLMVKIFSLASNSFILLFFPARTLSIPIKINGIEILFRRYGDMSICDMRLHLKIVCISILYIANIQIFQFFFSASFFFFFLSLFCVAPNFHTHTSTKSKQEKKTSINDSDSYAYHLIFIFSVFSYFFFSSPNYIFFFVPFQSLDRVSFPLFDVLHSMGYFLFYFFFAS